jgi:hypothetical protein
MARSPISRSVETELLLASRRRCALCFGLLGDHGPKSGQMAHVSRDSSDSSLENLAWLCLVHHDEYDSRRSQSKGFTPEELRRYRAELYRFILAQRASLEPGRQYVHMSTEALALSALLNERSRNGFRFDPQIRIDQLPSLLALGSDDLEIATDELVTGGLVELNGSRDVIFATNRLFWETDAIFGDSDPATDAAALARALVARDSDIITLAELSSLLAWSPRRLNPATTYLTETENAMGLATLGSAPYCLHSVRRTTATKRFVRDLDRGRWHSPGKLD